MCVSSLHASHTGDGLACKYLFRNWELRSMTIWDFLTLLDSMKPLSNSLEIVLD